MYIAITHLDFILPILFLFCFLRISSKIIVSSWLQFVSILLSLLILFWYMLLYIYSIIIQYNIISPFTLYCKLNQRPRKNINNHINIYIHPCRRITYEVFFHLSSWRAKMRYIHRRKTYIMFKS